MRTQAVEEVASVDNYYLTISTTSWQSPITVCPSTNDALLGATGLPFAGSIAAASGNAAVRQLAPIFHKSMNTRPSHPPRGRHR